MIDVNKKIFNRLTSKLFLKELNNLFIGKMISMRHSTPKIIPVTRNDYYNNENQENQRCQFQPMFGGYQLVGDNLLVRFTNQILYNSKKFPYGSRTINYCINGQRIDQLRQRIYLKAFPLSSRVMVMIGTNDILCGGNIGTMKKHFNALLKILKKSVNKILILTLPPIPKLSVTFYHWTLIRQYNNFLKSLEDGKSIVVADICPLFTRFIPALQYEISEIRNPHLEKINHGKKRKSWPIHRRTKASENRRSLPTDLRSDESDYRSSTDTNNSVDSEVPSSEDRENVKNNAAGERKVRTCQKGYSENNGNQGRLFMRTLESVFGKELLNRKKMEEQSGISSMDQPEKKLRKSPMDLNENLCLTDSWLIESGEDSMSEHVYKSQDETDYVMEFSYNGGIEGNGEFSKFIESLNEIEKAPTRNFCCKRYQRDNTTNDKSQDAESSSSSSIDSSKRQIYPIIDPEFRYFFENSTIFGDNFQPNSPESSLLESRNCSGKSSELRDSKYIDGLSRRDKLLLNLSSQICYLEFYEVFHFSRKRRIDMIHLNYKGLHEVKNFLTSNNYVNV